MRRLKREMEASSWGRARSADKSSELGFSISQMGLENKLEEVDYIMVLIGDHGKYHEPLNHNQPSSRGAFAADM